MLTRNFEWNRTFVDDAASVKVGSEADLRQLGGSPPIKRSGGVVRGSEPPLVDVPAAGEQLSHCRHLCLAQKFVQCDDWGAKGLLRNSATKIFARKPCAGVRYGISMFPTESARVEAMELDDDKLDAAALAIMSLTLHDGRRVWKGVDWAVTDRLYEKGLIENPAGRAKSLVLTDEGLAEAKAVLAGMFGKA